MVCALGLSDRTNWVVEAHSNERSVAFSVNSVVAPVFGFDASITESAEAPVPWSFKYAT